MVQSRHWMNSKGYVTVTRANGDTFSTNPLNIGVESELYTRFLEDGAKDTVVEEWFAEVIDAPATQMLEHLLDPANVTRKSFRVRPNKRKTLEEIGFKANHYIDLVSIPSEVRQAISGYVAALLVRNPLYLDKLKKFHAETIPSSKEAKNRALDNMLYLFDVYKQKILQSVFILTKRISTSEYVYSDGGLIVDEPWRHEFNIPFDIHAPLTPDISIQILPVPSSRINELSTAAIGEQTNQGVARMNRIILAGAQRFVFSRQVVPSSFIVKNFGKPAPRNIGYRVTKGKLEAFYNPNRT